MSESAHDWSSVDTTEMNESEHGGFVDDEGEWYPPSASWETNRLDDCNDAPDGWEKVSRVPRRWESQFDARDRYDAEHNVTIRVEVVGGSRKHPFMVVDSRLLNGRRLGAYTVSPSESVVSAPKTAKAYMRGFNQTKFDVIEPRNPFRPIVADGVGDKSEDPKPHSQFDYKRYERAVQEDVDVERVAPRVYGVMSSDGSEQYQVDMATGNCTCPDAMFRSKLVCKHAVRACVQMFFDGRPLTRYVARVIAAIRRDGCIFGHDECAGPVGEVMPCADCLNAVSVSPRTGYQMTVQRSSYVSNESGENGFV